MSDNVTVAAIPEKKPGTLETVFTKGAKGLDVLQPLYRWANIFGTSVFLIIVLLTFADVFLRYVFNKPIIGSTDLVGILLCIMVAFGIPWAHVQKAHITCGVVMEKLNTRQKAAADVMLGAVSLGIFILLTWQTFNLALRFLADNNVSDTLRIPLTPFALVISIGVGLITLVITRDLLADLAKAMAYNFAPKVWAMIIGVPVFVYVVLALFMFGKLGEPSALVVGIGGVLGMVLVFLLGLPVGFSLALVSFVGMVYLKGLAAGFSTLGAGIFRTANDYSFAALAFFMLMGYVCYHGNLSAGLYKLAYRWIGHIRGGLAQTTVLAGAAIGAVLGSSAIGALTLGVVALPEMRKYKYSDALAAGCVGAAGGLSNMIPPSLGFILYGLISGESIGKLFIAGILPGIVLMILFMVTVNVWCRINPTIAPSPGEKFSWKERVVSIKYGGPIGALFVLVIGGMYTGIFTPTEGGAIGTIGALILTFITRDMNWTKFKASMLDGGKLTAAGFLMMGGVTMFGNFVTASKLTPTLASWIVSLPVSPMVIMIGVILIMFVLGCFIPSMALIIVCTPLFYPVVVSSLHYDPIWFGVQMVLMMECGAMTPPYGINLFMVKAVQKDTPIIQIFKGVLPFTAMMIIANGILLVWPGMATLLPNLLKGGG